MGKKFFFIINALVCYCTAVFAQVPDWSTKIAPILYANCVTCHRQGGIAPFELMSYQMANIWGGAIANAVATRKMPPWPADPSYRRFAHETILDTADINAIVDWVAAGKPSGNLSLAPAPPVFNPSGSLLDTIDYTVQIPPYTLQYLTDEYRYFAVHTNFADTVYVSKIEVIPGLPEFVHHADIHYDLSGVSYYNDSITPLPGFSGGLTSDYYMNAWQPGGNIAEYPANWGIAVPPGADFVLEIHYGPGGMGLTDTTKMNLRFITNPVNVRPIKVKWMLNNPIPSEGPLIIPPNVVTTFHQESAPMPADRSLISICPHMHMLGKSYKVWFKTVAGDSIPLINIPQWEFHWQKYYMFRKIQKIPAGAKIYAEASFDNTTNNHHNPNNPPITVQYGSTTTDEMLMTYFIYADYQPGDEDIILDTTLLTSLPFAHAGNTGNSFQVYPNPMEEHFYADAFLAQGDRSELMVQDITGRILKLYSFQTDFMHQYIEMRYQPAGLYFVTLKTGDRKWVRRIIKH